MEKLEELLAKALSEALNYRGPHRTAAQNNEMSAIADKLADVLGDVRFSMGRR